MIFDCKKCGCTVDRLDYVPSTGNYCCNRCRADHSSNGLLIEPPEKRKIIQIAFKKNDTLVALCNDQTVWFCSGGGWTKYDCEDIPQDEIE